MIMAGLRDVNFVCKCANVQMCEYKIFLFFNIDILYTPTRYYNPMTPDELNYSMHLVFSALIESQCPEDISEASMPYSLMYYIKYFVLEIN